MWEKADLLMTSAVTKILGIEDTIPNVLGFNHHPYHLNHTVAALDRSNLNLLVETKRNI